jgi:hypothetical protein
MCQLALLLTAQLWALLAQQQQQQLNYSSSSNSWG